MLNAQIFIKKIKARVYEQKILEIFSPGIGAILIK